MNIRNTLKTGLKRANQIIDDLGCIFSYQEFHSLFVLKDNERLSVLRAFDRYISSLKNAKRIGTAISYNSAKKSFANYHKELMFTDISPSLLYEYEEYMLSKGVSITTVGLYVRSLRTIYNRAIDERLITNDNYPFGQKIKRKYEIPKGVNVKKALDLETITKIINFKPESDKIEFARDM